jgi:hypothetical protein
LTNEAANCPACNYLADPDGVCAQGIADCGACTAPTTYAANENGGKQVCDKLDNDCSGATDQACTGTPSCTSEVDSAAIGWCKDCANDPDCPAGLKCIAFTGKKVCTLACSVGESGDTACATAYGPSAWKCTSKGCLKECTVLNQATDCPWSGWACADVDGDLKLRCSP